MEYAYLANINDQASTNGSPTDLLVINVGTGAATAVVTVYNGKDATAPVVATIDAATPNCFQFEEIHLSAGMFVKLTTAAAKVTVSYS